MIWLKLLKDPKNALIGLLCFSLPVCFFYAQHIATTACEKRYLEAALNATNDAIVEHDQDAVTIAESEIKTGEAKDAVKKQTIKIITKIITEPCDIISVASLLDSQTADINTRLQALYD